MNYSLLGFAAAVTVGAALFFGSSTSAEAACRTSTPCVNGPTATIECPGGSVTVSGAAEVVCTKFRGGGQLVGIVGGGAGGKPAVAPAPAPRAPAPKPTIKAERRAAAPVQASVGGKSSLSRTGSCGTAFQGETARILILDCPNGSSVTYVAGVPGQAQLLKAGLILVQNSKAPKGCLWAKSVQSVNGYKFRGQMLDVNYVVKPAKGVLRPEGGISYKSASGKVAAYEMTPGACGNGRKSVAMTVQQLIGIRH